MALPRPLLHVAPIKAARPMLAVKPLKAATTATRGLTTNFDAKARVLQNIAESKAARAAHSQAMRSSPNLRRINIGGMNTSFIGKPVGRERFRTIDSTLRALGRDYPSVARDIDKVQFANVGRPVAAPRTLSDGSVRYPKGYARGKPTPIQTDQGARWKSRIVMDTDASPENMTQYILNHEFGHQVQFKLDPGRITKGSSYDDMSVEFRTAMAESFGVSLDSTKTKSIIGVGRQPEDIAPAIGTLINSNYAKTSLPETFAESFASMRAGVGGQGLTNLEHLIDRSLEAGSLKSDYWGIVGRIKSRTTRAPVPAVPSPLVSEDFAPIHNVRPKKRAPKVTPMMTRNPSSGRMGGVPSQRGRGGVMGSSGF